MMKVETKLEGAPVSEEGEGRRRRRVLCWCGTSGVIILGLGIVCVIVGVTVYKVRDPKVSVNSVSLDRFSFNMDTLGLHFDLNVTLHLNLSVKNPNKASFEFGNSTTQLYYRGINCGEAFIPAGKVDADRSVELNSSVTIIGDRLVSKAHLMMSDALSGLFPLSTSTRISGRLNVLNVFKHHAVSYSHCDLSIAIANRSIQSETCSHTLKL